MCCGFWFMFPFVFACYPCSYGGSPVLHPLAPAHDPSDGIVVVAELLCCEACLAFFVQIFLDLFQSWFSKSFHARVENGGFSFCLLFIFSIKGGVGGRGLFSFSLFSLHQPHYVRSCVRPATPLASLSLSDEDRMSLCLYGHQGVLFTPRQCAGGCRAVEQSRDQCIQRETFGW